jgi:hypothetical protein
MAHLGAWLMAGFSVRSTADALCFSGRNRRRSNGRMETTEIMLRPLAGDAHQVRIHAFQTGWSIMHFAQQEAFTHLTIAK